MLHPMFCCFSFLPLNYFFAEIVYLVSFIASWLTSQPEDKSNQREKVIFWRNGNTVKEEIDTFLKQNKINKIASRYS